MNGTGTVSGVPMTPCLPSGTLNSTEACGLAALFVFVKYAASPVMATSLMIPNPAAVVSTMSWIRTPVSASYTYA
jgi:hypothetical protein